MPPTARCGSRRIWSCDTTALAVARQRIFPPLSAPIQIPYPPVTSHLVAVAGLNPESRSANWSPWSEQRQSRLTASAFHPQKLVQNFSLAGKFTTAWRGRIFPGPRGGSNLDERSRFFLCRHFLSSINYRMDGRCSDKRCMFPGRSRSKQMRLYQLFPAPYSDFDVDHCLPSPTTTPPNIATP